jgi:hypothetical protein
MRLFSYKLTTDSGFAPNPFYGMLTLATCKPGIRRTKKKGDWIAGFTSGKLCGDKVGKEKLVYLMQVTEKVTIAEYFQNPKYRNKKPRGDSDYTATMGDNIYAPCYDSLGKLRNYSRIENSNHGPNDQQHDVSGQYALISTRFYYFGKSAIEIPRHVRPNVPKSQTSYGVETRNNKRIKEFIAHIEKHYEIGIHGQPHDWDENSKLKVSSVKKCRFTRKRIRCRR